MQKHDAWQSSDYFNELGKEDKIRHKEKITLNLVSVIFIKFLFFSPNDSPSKSMKNAFYFIEKALFVLKIFNFLYFFPFLSTLSRHKSTSGSGIIYDVMNWLA